MLPDASRAPFTVIVKGVSPGSSVPGANAKTLSEVREVVPGIEEPAEASAINVSVGVDKSIGLLKVTTIDEPAATSIAPSGGVTLATLGGVRSTVRKRALAVCPRWRS